MKEVKKPISAAERLLARSKDNVYNALLKKFAKEADKGKTSLNVLGVNLIGKGKNPMYTFDKLQDNGFRIYLDTTLGYEVYTISWSNGEES